jgi:DNA-directed RNA polymerase subunit H (RpoH/RPB5)
MEKNRSLYSVFKSETEKTEIIINNVLIMLSSRIYLDGNKDKHALLDYTAARKKLVVNDDNTYTIVANNGDTYAIKIFYQKILSTGKQSLISEFIKEYESARKIIIASSFNNKTADFATKNGSQIFAEGYMLRDLVAHDDQPIFELLSPKEVATIKSEYGIDTHNAPKIIRSDGVVKYYNLKKDDFVRAIELSPTSGLIVTYQVIS